jgi:hypothetical protein
MWLVAVHLSWRGMVPHVAVARVEWGGNRLSRFHNRGSRAACFHVFGARYAAVEVDKRMRAAISGSCRSAIADSRQEREIGHSPASFRMGCQIAVIQAGCEFNDWRRGAWSRPAPLHIDDYS